MDAVSPQSVSLNDLRVPARAGDQICAKGIAVRSKSVSAKRCSRSSTHSLFKRVLRFEVAQRGCVGPDATPHDLGNNPIRSEFNTTIENGQRTKLEETFFFDHDDDGGQTTPDIAKTTTYDWVYDTNDRLLSETIDHHDDALDRTESFVMDLFGNRTARTINYVDPTAVDQAFAYSYDDNDRLVNETLDDGADSTVDKTTQYTWDSTQQTAKEVFTGASTNPADLVSSQTFNYDLQGRLAEVITSPETGPATKVTYSYDSAGIRVSSSQFTDTNTNGVFETSELDHTIEYLVDHRNHTGYAQTISETTTDGNGDNVKRITTTFGTDELSQTTYTPDPATADAWLAEAMHFFGHDAHGSVRVLLDALGEIAQTFTYAAYGELLAIYDSAGALVGTLGTADTSAALTNLLYSGESFDSRIGQQYLRARWYGATAGRFSRLDPFSGVQRDPLSLNKYLYTHSNPIRGIDPSGESLVSAFSGLSIGIYQRFNDAAARAIPVLNHVAIQSHYWLITNSLRIQFWMTAGTLGSVFLDAGLTALLRNTTPVPTNGFERGEWFERKLGANASHYEIIDDHRGGVSDGTVIRGGEVVSFKSSDPKLNSGGTAAPPWEKAIREIEKEVTTVANKLKPNSSGFQPRNSAPVGSLPIKPNRGAVFYFVPQERVSWLQNPTFRQTLRNIQSANNVIVRFIPVPGFRSRR